MAAKTKSLIKKVGLSAKKQTVLSAGKKNKSDSVKSGKPRTIKEATVNQDYTPNGLSVPVYNLENKAAESIKLPKEIFNSEVNMQLIAQAIRVYLENQRADNAQVKTRGEVAGSTKKIYRQKGTGRARHGSIRAPIFVGGGIVFGPQKRNYGLKFSKIMKLQALQSVFTLMAKKGAIRIIDGFITQALKTKDMVKIKKTLGIEDMKTLFIISPDDSKIQLAVRNIPNTECVRVSDVTTYDIAINEIIVLTKQSLIDLEKIRLFKD